jgi:uncharacterized protein (DUF736 family)
MTELNASFSLFPAQEKKSERSPDYSGVIEIPADQVDALVAHLGTQPENNWKNEPVLKLRIAGWKAQSQGGKNYLNGKISVPMQQQQQAPVANDDEMPF